MKLKAKVIKVGNSAGIIIPKVILDASGWHVGDTLDIQVKNNGFLITKIKSSKEIISWLKEHTEK